MSVFSIFTTTNYTFEGQYPDEQVIMLLHRHWFVLFKRCLVFIVMAFVPLGIYIFAYDWVAVYGLNGTFIFLCAIYYLFWWYYLFYTITMYALDTWIITDHRVIDSEQHGFFSRTVAELNLAKIQDVSTTTHNFIETMLKFGDLDVQTAGTNPKFSFKEIPNPEVVEAELLKAHNQYMAKHPGGAEDEVV